jgi:hypothetical protein
MTNRRETPSERRPQMLPPPTQTTRPKRPCPSGIFAETKALTRDWTPGTVAAQKYGQR